MVLDLTTTRAKVTFHLPASRRIRRSELAFVKKSSVNLVRFC